MSPLSTSFCPIKEGAIENKRLYCTTEQNRLANSSGSTRMRKTVSADGIRDIVAESFDLDPDLLIGKSRKRPIVDARQVAMFFCKRLTQPSLEAIGRRFGGRDHSTVIHACRAVQARIDTDPGFMVQVELIAQRLQTRVPSV